MGTTSLLFMVLGLLVTLSLVSSTEERFQRSSSGPPDFYTLWSKIKELEGVLLRSYLAYLEKGCPPVGTGNRPYPTYPPGVQILPTAPPGYPVYPPGHHFSRDPYEPQIQPTIPPRTFDPSQPQILPPRPYYSNKEQKESSRDDDHRAFQFSRRAGEEVVNASPGINLTHRIEHGSQVVPPGPPSHSPPDHQSYARPESNEPGYPRPPSSMPSLQKCSCPPGNRGLNGMPGMPGLPGPKGDWGQPGDLTYKEVDEYVARRTAELCKRGCGKPGN